MWLGVRAGHAEMRRLLAAGPAEAYFMGDDVLSIGALSAARAAGVRVPEDLGIIGLNDMEMAGWANINLTTLHQPFAAIVRSSMDLMVPGFADPGRLPEARIHPCHIIERGVWRAARTRHHQSFGLIAVNAAKGQRHAFRMANHDPRSAVGFGRKIALAAFNHLQALASGM